MTGAMLPIQLAPRRFWLAALALCGLSAATIAFSPLAGYVDFPQFWSAGGTVGTVDLLDPVRHGAWELAHGFRAGLFAYPPGAAWLFAPLAMLPLPAAFAVHAALVAALVAASGWLGARIYGLEPRMGLVAAFAWAPCLGSAAYGQTAMLGLFLALVCIEGLRRDDDRLAGVAVGLLLFKPTLAAPLLGLMLLRRRWLGLAVAGGLAVAWFLASVAATAGDWGWLGRWLGDLATYYPIDSAANGDKAISLPGVLIGLGLGSAVAVGIGASLVVAALPRLLRAPLPEAAAGACLIGLVASPHSLNYEATMLLPALLWAAGGLGTGLLEPARTRIVVAAYLAVTTYWVTTPIGAGLVAVVVLAGSLFWITGYRQGPVAHSERFART